MESEDTIPSSQATDLVVLEMNFYKLGLPLQMEVLQQPTKVLCAAFLYLQPKESITARPQLNLLCFLNPLEVTQF